MLNENDDLGRLADETAAAMRDLAGTVTDAPPLRLTAEATGLSPARQRRRSHGPWLRWFWSPPVLAAFTVVAVAVALVIVRDLPNGGVGPRTTAPAAVNSPDRPAAGVPEYYVALHPASGQSGAPNGLIVGDTRTGQTVAVIAPPAGTSFVSVSAATDDRTFAAVAAPTSGGSDHDAGFYLLTIAPGSSPAARLAQLPMEPLPGVFATALSASGKELAVATAEQAVTGGPVIRRLTIYSVATGRPLRSWPTASTTAIVPDTGPSLPPSPYGQYPALSWIDGDRAIAFPVLSRVAQPVNAGLYSLVMRSVDIAAAAGDLMAVSKVIADLGRSLKSTGTCGTAFPVLSGNGTTLFCLASDGPAGHTNPTTVRWVLEWRPMQTRLANGAEWRSFPSIKTIGVPAGSTVDPVTVWSSSTGASLLVEWTVITSSYNDTGAHGTSVRFGELTLGRNEWTFTPLPAPAIFAAGGGAPSIAW